MEVLDFPKKDEKELTGREVIDMMFDTMIEAGHDPDAFNKITIRMSGPESSCMMSSRGLGAAYIDGMMLAKHFGDILEVVGYED